MSSGFLEDRGLITPIVQDADRKGLKSISKEVRSLAQKAKDNALKPNEFMGGTFTVREKQSSPSFFHFRW